MFLSHSRVHHTSSTRDDLCPTSVAASAASSAVIAHCLALPRLPLSPPQSQPFLLLLLPIFGWLLSAPALPLLPPPLPATAVAAVGCQHRCHCQRGRKPMHPDPSAAAIATVRAAAITAVITTTAADMAYHCPCHCPWMAMSANVLSATPLKRQTFLSVVNMLEMSQHVGNILICRPIFRLSESCRWDLLPTHTSTCM